MSIRIVGDDLLGNLLTFAMNSVPGAIGAGISVASEIGDTENCSACGDTTQDARKESEDAHSHPGQPRSVAATGVAKELDAAQWAQAEGPLWRAFRSGMVLSLPDPDGYDDANRLGMAELKDIAEDVIAPIRGVVFSPGEWGGELPVILSVYLDREPDADTLQQIDRCEPLVSQALAVVEYCSGQEQVAQQMLQMTQYRRVIEQAKGLIMGALGCDAATAFSTLSRSSQHFNVRLRNLSVALVEHVGAGSGSAEHPPDSELRVSPNQHDREVAGRVWAALSTSTAILPG